MKNLLHLKRKLIVWYYLGKEPYRTTRRNRWWKKNAPIGGMVGIKNNIEPMIEAMKKATQK